ncbi:ribosomal small subunit pseudouridine synthase A [Hypnocyclicus thermotrophus]|uniref:Pseudouridine synthase n=1 Tax=Hypnocyclicus thermotrophus TaxID=1627895 RepID=A0AA46I5R5_9FUSO|nr:16S rRNA pseudouridine(516) synthase [Hypnocyclicus thermotrophus]TDT71473.1 ribosomal small subunit pseudouridine synthase A [Hypnocyclicus thermotrophus]
MRLDKYLTECGIGTRSEVKNIIKSGKIKVNDIIIKNNNIKINENKDIISYNNNILKYKAFRYYVLNKPNGVISATEDNIHRTVLDILPNFVIKKNLFPVGRLDIDTEGLLLLTNDGKFAHSLLSPKKHIEKTYEVHLKNEISKDDIYKLENGVIILNNYLTKPSKVNKLKSNKILLTIIEGKFHQVKEMLKAINNEVVYLKRIKFANLSLDKLNITTGEVIEINKEDII